MAEAGAASADSGLVEIDGSILEGGGQILRNCFALAAILSKQVRISKIRAGRSSPGLRPQHMASLKLVDQICPGKLAGCKESSFTVMYSPASQAKGGDFLADTQTAGSITLMTQASLPVCCFASGPIHMTLKGGTDTKMSPPLDSVMLVLAPILSHFGVHVSVECEKRGFYPRGQGIVHVRVQPVHQLRPIVLTDRGVLTGIRGRVFAHDLSPDVAKRMITAAKTELRAAELGVPIDIEYVHIARGDAVGVGIGITLMADTSTGCVLTADALGERGVPAEELGTRAAMQLIQEIKMGGCVDEHIQDQIIIFMALAAGESRVRIGEMSLHSRTAMHFAEVMAGVKFTVTPCTDNPLASIMSCTGIGLVNAAVVAAPQ